MKRNFPAILLFVLALLAGCTQPPAETPAPVYTEPSSPTETPSPIPEPTQTATRTPTPTSTATTFPTPVLLPTVTPTRTPTPLPPERRGNLPSDLVIIPDGSRLYVSAMGTHNVFVIDTKTDVITDVIDLWEGESRGSWPFRLAITPDGGKIYVANMMSDNISVIDTRVNRVVTTIDLGHFVHDVAFAPDGQTAYADLGWDRLAVIDPNTDTVVGTILLEKGDQTYTLAVSRDGHRVYAASQAGGGRIYVIDAATNSLSDRFDLGKNLSNQGLLTMSADDRKLYLTSGITNTSYERPEEGANKIYVIDPSERSVTAEIEVMGGPIAMRLSPDGKGGYVSTFAAKQVFEIDLTGNAVVGEIQWGKILANGQEWRRSDLRDMTIAPDGAKLYITGWDADAILVADLATHRMTRLIEFNPVMTLVYEISITPDGKRAYVSSEAVTPGARSSLFVIDTATNTVVDEIIRNSYPRNPYLEPNGRFLYAVSADRLLQIEVATNRVIREIPLGYKVKGPYDVALVPGREKAYITDVRDEFVYVVDLAASAVTKRINVGWWPQMVVTTADGRRAYVSRQNNPYDRGGLTVIDTENDQVIATIEPPVGTTGTNGRFDMLVVSPDGAYVYWETSPDHVNVVEVASNTVVRTINLGGDARHVWATRGVHPSDIAFTSDGLRAYIPCGDAFYVAILDVSTGKVIGRIDDVGLEPVAIVITPDDRFAYVTNKESESISVIDLSTDKVVVSISLRR
ncbi:MAG: beta-propeller fold lactonase family protein [Chloroflexi bacterium]|nr:beta-propeller fold lactonase family protein [Chloroflexota bacterium]